MLTKDDLIQIKNVIKDELSESEERISREFGSFINDEILPQLDLKADKTDIERLERKIDSYNIVNLKNRAEIKKIKSHIGLTPD